MLSANRLKQIQSLKTKKGRLKENLFLIEGKRALKEYLQNSELLEQVIITDSEASLNTDLLKLCNEKKIDLTVIQPKLLKTISDTKTPSGLIGICKIDINIKEDFNSDRWLYLYKIKDPGNLGTILRTAAWFNIKNIGLSAGCVDPFNTKVVRSAMGAHAYIKIHQHLNFDDFIKNNYQLFGADQNGEDCIEKSDYDKKIVLCLGGESVGFNESLKEKFKKIVSIKRVGYGESLNVAIAGSILMKDISEK